MTNESKNKNCANCKHWGGTGRDDSAGCQAPLPQWVAKAIVDDELDVTLDVTPGWYGVVCKCWEAEE